jgi:serine/arginine repetitive matrix protein 2
MDAVRLPSHPYAQGGVYSRVRSRDESDHSSSCPSTTFVGPHPVHYEVSGGVLEQARHHPSSHDKTRKHPYAAVNDSQTQLIVHPRLDSAVSPLPKAWAEAKPGISQEVLPVQLDGAPQMTQLAADGRFRRIDRRNQDRVSIGEALTYSMFERASRDSGLGTSEGEHHLDFIPEGLNIDFGRSNPHTDSVSHRSPTLGREPVKYDVNRPIHTSSQTQSMSPSHLTIGSFGSSMIENNPHHITPPPNERHGSSGEVTSRASSPPISPPPLGNFDDMDNFRDLFYRPEISMDNANVPLSISSTSISINGGMASRGLTSLTRKFNQELAQMQNGSDQQQPVHAANDHHIESGNSKPRYEEYTDASVLHFDPLQSQAFQPSGILPEDVCSSRASSPLEPASEEDHDLRLSSVEAIATPVFETGDYRLSQRLSLVEEEDTLVMPRNLDSLAASPPLRDSLRPPISAYNSGRVSSGGLTRSSMVTSSTSMSRMSGLSDFPAPPEYALTPAHASIINSFFEDNAELPAEFQQYAPDTHAPEPDRSRRFTFGADDMISSSPTLAHLP